MGGADQWGNITAGLELIRKEFGAGEWQDLAFGLSYPLLTNRIAASSSARRRPVRASGSTRRRRARSPSTSTGSTPTTATSASTCAAFTLFDRAEDRGAGGGAGGPPGDAGGAEGDGLRPHGARPRRGRGRQALSGSARLPSRRSRSATRKCSRACTRPSTTSTSRPRTWPAERCGSPWRAASSPRTARRGGRSPRAVSRSTTSGSRRPRTRSPAPIAGRYLVVRMGKKALRIGRLLRLTVRACGARGGRR